MKVSVELEHLAKHVEVIERGKSYSFEEEVVERQQVYQTLQMLAEKIVLNEH